MSATVIRVSVNEHVQLCTIERPERRNAFDQEHYVALANAMAEAATDDDVHVLVITGIGASFSAGQDLKEMAALASGTASGPHDGFPRLVDQLDTFPKPLLAAVNGDAVGIGLTMLLHCDIAVVAHDARLRVPFSELGVPPEAGSSALLGDVMGWQQAAELLFTSRWIDGDEAVQMGLALKAVQRADVLRLEFCAEVVAWRRLDSLAAVARLRGQHVWREDVLAQRFDWGHAQGIFALAVRVARLPERLELPLLPAYGGCKSWITLATDLPIEGSKPALNDLLFDSAKIAVAP